MTAAPILHCTSVTPLIAVSCFERRTEVHDLQCRQHAAKSTPMHRPLFTYPLPLPPLPTPYIYTYPLPSSKGCSSVFRAHQDNEGDGASPLTPQHSTSPTPSTKATALAAAMTQYSLEVSYLEIYNETVRDLFNPSATPAGAVGGGGGGDGAGGGRGFLRVREDPRYPSVQR